MRTAFTFVFRLWVEVFLAREYPKRFFLKWLKPTDRMAAKQSSVYIIGLSVPKSYRPGMHVYRVTGPLKNSENY